MNLPNKITLTRIFLIPVIVLFLLVDFKLGVLVIGDFALPYEHIIALIIFLIAAATDGIDGYIARKHNLITNLGKFLDPLADKLLVMAALISLVEIERLSAWFAIIIITRELAVTGLRLLAAADGTVIAASKLGKLKTATQILAITLLMVNNYPFALFSWPVADIVIWLAVIITLISGFDYFYKNLHAFKENKAVFNRNLKEMTALLRTNEQTVAVAESLTGGLIGHSFTNIAGSSEVYLGGIIAYDNQVKERILKVPADTLRQEGAVSQETATIMADNVRSLYGSDYGLAVTGVAGPGELEGKPAGLVYLAISRTGHESQVHKLNLTGSREAIKQATVEHLLELFIKELEKPE